MKKTTIQDEHGIPHCKALLTMPDGSTITRTIYANADARGLVDCMVNINGWEFLDPYRTFCGERFFCGPHVSFELI